MLPLQRAGPPSGGVVHQPAKARYLHFLESDAISVTVNSPGVMR
jgi:hypothetical protein